MRQIPINDACPLFNLACETTFHLLVSCDFSKACWERLGISNTVEMNSLFSEWLAHKVQTISGERLLYIPMLCWALLRNRNELIWNQKSLETHAVISLDRGTLLQWQSAQNKSFDSSLGYMHVQDGLVKWRCPPLGFSKFNTDAALFIAPNRFSYSVVARNHEGKLVEARVKCRAGHIDSDATEALSIKEALSWIKTQNLHQVVIESDSLVTVQSIRNKTKLLSYFGRIVEDCRLLLYELRCNYVSLNFVKRSANIIVHYLVYLYCF